MICAGIMAQAEPPLRLISNVIWSQSDGWFGGFSGAEVTANGAHITLVTDKGTLVTARMIRRNGALRAMQVRSRTPLTDISGTNLSGVRADAEGLAIDGRGRAFVSFERDHRIAAIQLKSARVMHRIPGANFAHLKSNSGLEALAVRPNGTLFTLPERSGAKRAAFPVYTFANGRWAITHHIPRRGPFLPVGADFSEEGRFYLLERAATPLGFRSRIRRFDLDMSDLDEKILMTTGPGQFDNLEALSVWKDRSGQTHLTLISDDNFLAIQQTQIVEFAVAE